MYTIDLNFQGIPGAIASYLIPHDHGAVLVESGPGSTVPALQKGLRQHGFTEKDITGVFLTHIHLDHAGAVGEQGTLGTAFRPIRRVFPAFFPRPAGPSSSRRP